MEFSVANLELFPQYPMYRPVLLKSPQTKQHNVKNVQTSVLSRIGPLLSSMTPSKWLNFTMVHLFFLQGYFEN